MWKTRYASDPGIIGRTVIVNGTPANVIGVMPDGFRFPQNTDRVAAARHDARRAQPAA